MSAVGTLVTARWQPARIAQHGPRAGDLTLGRVTRAEPSYVTATGRITAIDGEKLTLDCDGSTVVVHTSWIQE